MPPPRMTILIPLPVPGATASGSATAARAGSRPRDCIATKAALNPPACPTRVINSRREKLIRKALLSILFAVTPEAAGMLEKFAQPACHDEDEIEACRDGTCCDCIRT